MSEEFNGFHHNFWVVYHTDTVEDSYGVTIAFFFNTYTDLNIFFRSGEEILCSNILSQGMLNAEWMLCCIQFDNRHFGPKAT